MSFVEIRKWLRANRKEMIAFLEDLVSIPSENPPGNRYPECAERIRAQLEHLGMESEMIRVPTGNDSHAIAEMSRQMTLIAEADGNGNVGGCQFRSQQHLRALDAAARQILMRRKSDAAFERVAEPYGLSPATDASSESVRFSS